MFVFHVLLLLTLPYLNIKYFTVNGEAANINEDNSQTGDRTSGVLSSRVVRTKYGDLRGVIVTLESRYLDPVEVFKGIPYASPPLGSLRFMPPVSGALWSGVKVADRFSPVCPQILPDIRNETAVLKRVSKGRLEYLKRILPFLVNQSEDCLYLNIYAPAQGIMRKCLMAWCNGSYNFKTKLRGSEIDLLNQMLESCEKNRPKEIQRNIRGVKYLKYWKGTEYRVMLLYLGFVVLKDVLSKEVYDHYLLLSCAVIILSCKNYLIYIDIAKILLEEYLEDCINIYGSDSISSNFHNLCHVIDDVRKFGCLSGISAYQFENSLGHLKSFVRSGKEPLTQIAHWVTRISNMNENIPPNSNMCVKRHLGDGIYKQIYFQDFMLSDDEKNSWFLSEGNDIVKMQHVTQDKERFCIIGNLLESKQDFFTTPFKSSKLNIYSSHDVCCNQSDIQHKFLPSISYEARDIKCKLFHLRYKNRSVFLPLLHTLDALSKS